MPTVSRVLREGGAALLVAIVMLALASTASASEITTTKLPNGQKRILYKVGPFKVIPGQNEIGYNPISEKPKVDGWITRIRPDLRYTNGVVPRVDVTHLHHGVWVNLSRQNATNGFPELFFAAGEEKTIMQVPKGYGYRYEATDSWLLNHMIHNLTPKATQVYMEYEIDFIPAGSKLAKGIKPVRPIWMDVMSGSVYPVFNVKKNSGGKDNLFTFPDDDPNAYPNGRKRNEWTVDRDGVLVATAGHLHPGGLYTDLWARRPGAKLAKKSCGQAGTARAAKRCRKYQPRGNGGKAHLFRSEAKYYEPAGAVSWDVSMTATRPDWRVKLKKGDVISTTATYGTGRAAWWESMGIMLAYMAEDIPGSDPFKKRVNWKGRVTHGHLRENRNHGGEKTDLPDARKLKSGVVNPGQVDILGFNYRLGDLRLPGARGRPPVVGQGQQITYFNQDNPRDLYHSLSSCKAPCNRATGIAYPLADGKVQFESGTLGTPRPITTGQLSWKTPTNLDAGTYNYFCRIHPFMRGAFRVKK